MPAPSTVDEFLELLRKSGVADDKRLDPYLESLRGSGGVPPEPNKLAALLIRDGHLTHFQAEQLLQGKWRRFTIGKYKVLERLGSGGMAHVYLCEHKLMRRRVAVKVLPTSKAAEPSSLERFYREARLVASLDHPNIVHAYDIDQDETLHFLVMEYVDGASLQDIIKRSGPMDPARAANYVYQAALGLEHAHAAGIVHRDIKPGNLLLDRGGTVKILDMGLGRFFNDEEDNLTRKFNENVLGTADYLAPEQVDDSHEADIRADIYSLGATFYFLLTGRTPFEEGTVAQKLIWHQTRQPKSIASFRSDVPAPLLAIIDKMMAKRPEDRYQQPRELSQALAAYAQRPGGQPSAADLPRLSPAAAGGAAQETQASAGSTHTGGSSRKGWQVTASGSSAQALAAPSEASASRPAAALPQAPAAQVPPTRPAAAPASVAPAVAAPAPATNHVAAPHLPTLPARAPGGSAQTAPERFWADLVEDTQPRAGAETLAESAALAPSSRRLRRKPGARRLWIVLAVVLAVVVLLAAILVTRFWNQLFHRHLAERRPLVVSRQGSGDNAYPSLAQAARAASAGDVIELADEQFEENAQLMAAQLKATAITVRAASGKIVVWTARKGSEDRPLLELSGMKGFILEGDRITFDGRGKMPNLIQITLQCPGLEIRDARLLGYTRHAVKLMNCEGDEVKYVRLSGLHAEAPPPDGAAVYLDANSDTSPKRDDFIDLSQCLRAGSPADLLRRRSEKVTGSHLKLPPGLDW